jgi:hypothetical protein
MLLRIEGDRMRMRVGSWIVVAVSCATGLATEAAAQSHRLAVRTGSLFSGASTTDPEDTRVTHLSGAGAGGLGANYFAFTGLADSDSGVISIDGSFGLEGGFGDPIQPPIPPDS